MYSKAFSGLEETVINSKPPGVATIRSCYNRFRSDFDQVIATGGCTKVGPWLVALGHTKIS